MAVMYLVCEHTSKFVKVYDIVGWASLASNIFFFMDDENKCSFASVFGLFDRHSDQTLGKQVIEVKISVKSDIGPNRLNSVRTVAV